MHNKYLCLVKEADRCIDNGEKINYFCSLLRSLMQTVSVSVFEIYSDLVDPDEGLDVNNILRRMHKPSDGDYIYILDEIIPRVRSFGWSSFCHGWFELYRNEKIQSNIPLTNDIQDWVVFRNDRIGHGVLDKNNMDDWSVRILEIIHKVLNVFHDVIPKIKNDNSIYVTTPFGDVYIVTPLVFKKSPLVIRKFINKRNVWALDVQILDWSDSSKHRIDIPKDAPTISFLPQPHGKFDDRDVTIKGERKSILANIPNRQSSIFQGRLSEQDELIDWISDQESRACLVYGDGGVGKTTLVLEVLNNLLDDEIELDSVYPTVISYYSAKLTRWTENGIIHYGSVSTAVEDAVRELLFICEEVLEKGWYQAQGKALIDRVASYLNDLGLEREDVILILDNTETMARKPGEEDDLARLISQISRKVARVVMTSRRREKVEARQVELLPMPEIDALNLFKKLGEEYSADAIIKAGDSRLRKIANKLGRKPLLIDVMARHVGSNKGGLESAYATVMQGSTEGLSEFLYEDAWMRMNESHRNVFLGLVCLDVPLDSRTVGWVCREMEVPHTEWLNSFYETHFGQITEYGSDYQMEFDSFAADFFRLKLDDYNETDKKSIKNTSQKVEDLAVRAEKARSEYRSDRVSEAFRTPSARAAKVEGARGNISEAIEWYEEAIKEDPHNSYLFDRYSWFMMAKARDNDKAELLSERALSLDDSNSDANVTMALILYKKGSVLEGDKFINNAVKLGKPEGWGVLRKGVARFYAAIHSHNIKDKVKLLGASLTLLRHALEKIDETDPYWDKNHSDARKYIKKAEYEVQKMRREI